MSCEHHFFTNILIFLLCIVNLCCCQIYSPYYYDDSLPADHNSPPVDHDEGFGAYYFSEYTLEGYHDSSEPAEECYTCHFSRRKGHEHGMANCDDPFSEAGIPVIKCYGGSCAKTTTTIGDGEYMLIRSCLPNCKDMADSAATVECCRGSKCNGSKVLTTMVVANLTVCGFVLMLGMIVCCVM